jgi:hypothetical protein
MAVVYNHTDQKVRLMIETQAYPGALRFTSLVVPPPHGSASMSDEFWQTSAVQNADSDLLANGAISAV